MEVDMKRFLAISLTLLLSCAFAQDTFRVAVVMPSAINDLAFSQSIYSALTSIQEEMGEDNFEISYADGTFIVDDAAAAIRDWASQGYDLVIGHGSQYGGAVEEIAYDFPNVSFAWGTAGTTFGLDNVFAYEAASDQGGYINGVIAATLSESGTIGVVGPIEVGDAKLYVDGFVAGAMATNPDATVNVNYIGSFSDVALGTEAANTHIAAGADVLTGSAQMVVGPIGVAKDAGVLWLGTQADQTELAPEVVVANQIYDWTVVLKPIIENVQTGTLGGTVYEVTLENGGLQVNLNENAGAATSAAIAAISGVIDGSISPLGE